MASSSSNLSSSVVHLAEVSWNCYNFTGPMVWCVCSIPCTGVGLPACVWLLWELIKRKHSGSANTYMLNLTVMDLVFNIFLLPTALNYFLFRNALLRKICFIASSFNVSGRPLFTACVCVDCYMAVVRPITYMKTRNSRYAVVVSVVVWSVVLACGTLIMIREDLVAVFTVTVCTLALPTITFCDIFILRTLRKPDPSGRADVHPQKQRALQTITNSLVITVMAYLPPLVLEVFSALMPLSPMEVLCNIEVPVRIACMLGSTLMPLLHLENMGSFQDLRRC
ncbi:hypothetical protein ACEWY4_026404 [Coilia grayii]|uniref:G-protein coupled receptors family 1 profile domain-containing protein n=1 Tax=Coilia grayii TaxID=363190 RepID=A0ABD1IUS6_9TELE